MMKDSYLGFTDGRKPMTKGRIENTLDKMMSYENKLMAEKDWVLARIIDGYVPEKEEGYTKWSNRIEGYTKPRTLYKLEKEGGFFEVTKTSYDFGLYVIEKGFTDKEKVEGYVKEEAAVRKEKEEEEQRKRMQEEDERKKKMDEDRRVRKEEYDRRTEEYRKKGEEIMNKNIKEVIEDAVERYWDDIKEYVTGTKQEFINYAILTYTVKIGNQVYINQQLKMLYSKDVKIQGNLTKEIDKYVYGKVFKVNDGDPKVAITSKVKAFYEGKEYRGKYVKKD